MKTLLAFILILFISSCDDNSNRTKENLDHVISKEIIIELHNGNYPFHYTTITIDDCEYIIGWNTGAYNSGYAITHKGNCKNPIHHGNK